MKRVFGLVALSLLAATSAQADVPSPEQTACFGQAVGGVCVITPLGGGKDQAGVCTETTCSRRTPDGPTTYDCILCAPTATGPAPATTDPAKNSTRGTTPKRRRAASPPKPDRTATLWTSIGVGLLTLGAGVGAASRYLTKRIG